ncbi:MAG: class I SAM-dependent methyltransferase [Rhizobiaceae bacterium]|nr:class I SAM-dependent methyltransferase [Rhizobiaceae bacterium]
MTPLGERIAGLIQAAGPISIADYMSMCLFDTEAGYYMTREPFGVHGDFTTAPEISQMFGELVAVWLAQAWQVADRPASLAIVEIGPGRGTLMKDIVRTIRRIAPDLASAAEFVLVETSPRLVDIQATTLKDSGPAFTWLKEIDGLQRKAALFVANEIFDAIPFRQFVRVSDRWLERVVALDDERFRFAVGTASLARDALAADLWHAPEGSVLEIAPAREALMALVASRIRRDGGAAIFFDYGHLQPGFGDTFQALRNHRYEDVFDNPGKADLTSHVDFSALDRVARSRGLVTRAMTQGDFLLGMGLLERAGRLGQNADAQMREAISEAVERLAGPDEMGQLFKVLQVAQRLP